MQINLRVGKLRAVLQSSINTHCTLLEELGTYWLIAVISRDSASSGNGTSAHKESDSSSDTGNISKQ